MSELRWSRADGAVAVAPGQVLFTLVVCAVGEAARVPLTLPDEEGAPPGAEEGGISFQDGAAADAGVCVILLQGGRGNTHSGFCDLMTVKRDGRRLMTHWDFNGTEAALRCIEEVVLAVRPGWTKRRAAVGSRRSDHLHHVVTATFWTNICVSCRKQIWIYNMMCA